MVCPTCGSNDFESEDYQYGDDFPHLKGSLNICQNCGRKYDDVDAKESCKICGHEALKNHVEQYHKILTEYNKTASYEAKTRGELNKEIKKLADFINVASFENPMNLGPDKERLEGLKNELASLGEAYDDEKTGLQTQAIAWWNWQDAKHDSFLAPQHGYPEGTSYEQEEATHNQMLSVIGSSTSPMDGEGLEANELDRLVSYLVGKGLITDNSFIASEAEMPEWFKNDKQRGDAEKALKDKINNTKANEFSKEDAGKSFNTLSDEKKSEIIGSTAFAGNDAVFSNLYDEEKEKVYQYYDISNESYASEEEVPTSMSEEDRARLELRNQDAEPWDEEKHGKIEDYAEEGIGTTWGRDEANLWPEHTDETQCITCGRSVSDHANPNTDYRGMNGTAPPTDHYFQGGDMGGSDDKLYFESKSNEDFGSDYQKGMDKSLGLKSVSSHYSEDTCKVCREIYYSPNEKREHLRKHYGAYFDQIVASEDDPDYEGDQKTIKALLKKNGSVTFEDFLAQDGDYPQDLGESKAHEDVTFAGRTEINNMEDLWNGASQNGRMSMLGELGWGTDMPHFEMEQFARRPWSEVRGSLEYLGEMEANFKWMKNVVGYESLQFSYDDEEKVKEWSEKNYHKSWDSMTDEEKARQEDQYRDRNTIKDVTSADESIQSPQEVLEQFIDQASPSGSGDWYNWQSYASSRGLTTQEIDEQWDEWGLDSLQHNDDMDNVRTIVSGFKSPQLRIDYSHLLGEAYTYDEIKADLDSQTKEERRITKEIFDTLGYDSLDQDGKTSLDILRKEFGSEGDVLIDDSGPELDWLNKYGTAYTDGNQTIVDTDNEEKLGNVLEQEQMVYRPNKEEWGWSEEKAPAVERAPWVEELVDYYSDIGDSAGLFVELRANGVTDDEIKAIEDEYRISEAGESTDENTCQECGDKFNDKAEWEDHKLAHGESK